MFFTLAAKFKEPGHTDICRCQSSEFYKRDGERKQAKKKKKAWDFLKKKWVSKNVSASMEKTEQCPNWKCVNEALIFTIPNEEWHKFHVGVKVLEVKRSETFFSPWCEKKLDSCSSVRLPKVCFSLALSEKKKKSANDLFILIYSVCFFSFFSWQIPFHRRIIAVFLKRSVLTDGGMYGGARAESGEVRRRWSDCWSFWKVKKNK